MALADSWHLRSCSPQCSVTGREFKEDEPFYTAIFPDPESEAFERRDFSEEAWKERAEDAETPFSFWRSIFKPRPVEEKVDIVDKENPETLLKRLVEEDEEHTENVRYILAVMLERKKLLVETDSQQTPNGLLRIYEHRKDGDLYIVKDPQIPLSEVDKVQDEVHALLSPPEPVVEETAAEPSAPDEEPNQEGAPDQTPADQQSTETADHGESSDDDTAAPDAPDEEETKASDLEDQGDEDGEEE
jgi:hypothetical protein